MKKLTSNIKHLTSKILRTKRRKVLAGLLAILILFSSFRLFLFLNPKEAKAATLSLSTTSNTIQIDVPNRYRAVMTTDDTDDFILISDRAEDDASPDTTMKIFGSAIYDETVWYILRHDDTRITTILESTPSRVRIRVEGCYDTTAGGACLEDVAGGDDDDIKAVEEYTFTTEGISASIQIDFEGGLALASGDTARSFSVAFNDINNNNIIPYSETILYGDGETESTQSADGVIDGTDDVYVTLQSTGNYQDVIFGSSNINGDKVLSNSTNGTDYYEVDDVDEAEAIDFYDLATQTLRGKGSAQFFVQFHDQSDLNAEDEREALFNDLTNPDYLSYTTGIPWDEQGAFFRDNFEAGNFSAWDTTTTDGGDLSITSSAGLAGTSYGLQAVIDDTNIIYSDKDHTAPDSGELRFRFYVDLNAITIPDGEEFVILSTPTGPSRPSNVWEIFNVYLGYSSGSGYYFVLAAQEDDDSPTWHQVYITDTPHYVEIHVERGAGDGRYRWWIDGILEDTESSQDNDGTFNALRETFFGVPGSIDSGTSGTIFLDELVVNDTGLPIGDALGFNEAEGAYTSDMVASDIEVDIDAGPNVSTLINDVTDVEAGATSITVDSTTGFPSSGFAYIEGDKFSYTGTTGTTFTGIPATGELSIIGHADNSVVSLSQRHTPLWKLRNYRKDDVPQNVTLEHDTLTLGSEYNASVKPFSTSYFAQELIWHSTFENDSAATSPDVGGAGTVNATTTFTSGRYGNGMLADANDESVTIAMANNLAADVGVIEFWYKSTSTASGYRTFVSSSKGNDHFNLQRYPNDTSMEFCIGGGTCTTWSSILTLYNGEWHHVRLSYDTTANSTYLYIDGVSQGQKTTDFPAIDTTYNLNIGSHYDGTIHINGIMDEFRIFSSNTTPSQVSKGGDTADSDEYLADPTNNYTLDFNDDDADNRAEYIWLGTDSPYGGVNMELSTDGVGSSEDFDWEYWNGTAWNALTVTEQDAGSSSFTGDGNFYFTPPSDWFPYSVNGSTDLYYIRGHLEGGSLTTDPIENRIQTDILLLHYQDNIVDANQTLKIPASTSGANPPVVYWNLDEGYGTTANDSSWHGNSGTISGAAWQEEGMCYFGKCLYFDGSNDEVTRVDDPEFDIDDGGSFTVSAWIRHPDIATNPDVIAVKYEGTGGDGGYRLQMEADGDISFGIDDENTSFPEDTVTSTSTDYDDNQWHHISAVKDANDNLYLYIDGNLIDTDATISATDSLGNNDDFYLGIDGDGSSNAWAGFIDEFKFYRYARSADEIKSDLAKGAGVKGAQTSYGLRDYSFLSEGLITYYPMDETSGTTVSDASGNGGEDVTLNNAQETGTAEVDHSTTTVIADDDNASLATTNDAYNDMYVIITGGGGCGVATNTERIITDYVYDATPTRTITVTPAFSAEADDCTFEIRHQLGGKFGNALHFDGHNDRGVNGGFDPPHQGTVAFWFNTSQGAQRQRIIGGHDLYEFDIESNDRLTNQFFAAGTTTDAPTVIAQNTWYHVVATYDYNSNKNQIFINGELDYETNESDDDPGNSLTMNLGNRNGAGDADGFKGKLDDVRIYNRVFSPAEASALYNWGPGPVGYWNMDEGSGTSTVLDRSGNGNNGTMNGSMTEEDWVPGKYGSGLELDGSDDYVQANDSASLSFSYNSGFTFMVWAKAYNNQANDSKFIEKKQSTTSIAVDGNSGVGGNKVDMQIRDSNGTNLLLLGTVPIFDDGNWHHIVGVKDGDNAALYFDGVKDDTGNASFSGKWDLGNVRIGYSFDAGTRLLEGNIDEAKIYNYARTPSQIIEDMNAGHPVGGSPLPSQVGYWRFDEGYGDTANDSGSTGNNGDLAAGTTCPQSGDSACPTWSSSGKFGKALDFDTSGATDDYVDMGNPSDGSLDFGTTDFSMTAWVKTTDTGRQIAGKYFDGATGAGWNMQISNTGKLLAQTQDGTNFVASTDDGAVINDGIWRHVAVVNDRDGNMTRYVDGAQTGTENSITSVVNVDNSYNFYVGRRNSSGSPEYLDGTVDEVKIYNTALTAGQVKIDYNMGGSATLGDVANQDNEGFGGNPPVGWWKMDENTGTGTDAVKDTSGNDNHGDMEASMTESDWVAVSGAPRHANGLSGSALDFDGSDDYLDMGDQSIFTFGNGSTDSPFSISAWINLRDVTNSTILAKRNSSSVIEYEFGFTNDALQIALSDDSVTNYLYARTSNLTTYENQWVHLVATYDGTSTEAGLKIYVDGVDSVNTTDINAYTAMDNSAATVKVGWEEGSTYAEGIIDDVRIYDYALTQAQIAYDFNRGEPIGHWRLDECSGTTANDSGFGNNNGTITIGGSGSNTSAGTCGGSSGEAWFAGATGKRNASLDFDGNDDYVDLPDISSMNFVTDGRDFSVSAWAYPNSVTPTRQRIIHRTEGVTPDYSWNLVWDDDVAANENFVFAVVDNGTQYDVEGSGGLPNNTWHHVAAVWTDATNTVQIFINGIEYTDGYPSTLGEEADGDFRIGTRSPTAGDLDHFDGQIDEVKIFNYALTADQIKREYNEAAVRFGPSEGNP